MLMFHGGCRNRDAMAVFTTCERRASRYVLAIYAVSTG